MLMQNTLNHLDILAMKMVVLHIERVAASAHNTANTQLYKSDNDSDSNSRELKMPVLELLPFEPATQHFKQIQFGSFKLQISSGPSNCLIREERVCASDAIQYL